MLFIKKIFIFAAKLSGSTSRSGNDTLTVETGVRIPYPIQRNKDDEMLAFIVFFVFICI